jgi:hypothetical protein
MYFQGKDSNSGATEYIGYSPGGLTPALLTWRRSRRTKASVSTTYFLWEGLCPLHGCRKCLEKIGIKNAIQKHLITAEKPQSSRKTEAL